MEEFGKIVAVLGAGALIVETISIDAQVSVATGYVFTGKSFQSLKNHFASGRLKRVMTDITVGEVHSLIKLSVDEELLLHREFVNKAKALFNSRSQNLCDETR